MVSAVCLTLSSRTVAAMVGWIKQILTTEQKKTDFKPESEEGPMQMFSPVS